MIAASFLATVVAAILAEAGLSFLGLGVSTHSAGARCCTGRRPRGAALRRLVVVHAAGSPSRCSAPAVAGQLRHRRVHQPPAAAPQARRPRGVRQAARAGRGPAQPARRSALHQRHHRRRAAVRDLRVDTSARPARAVSDVSSRCGAARCWASPARAARASPPWPTPSPGCRGRRPRSPGGDGPPPGRDGAAGRRAGYGRAELRLPLGELRIVFQCAMHALNPVLRFGAQFEDVLGPTGPDVRPGTRRRGRSNCWASSASPRTGGSSYPHELSGGMRQRATIAIALALDPDIIVMDEPTTALDVVMQRQILRRRSWSSRSEFGFSVVFITHDLSLLIEISDTDRRDVRGPDRRDGAGRRFYADPRHPYSRGCSARFPPWAARSASSPASPASPPDLRSRPGLRRSRPRCPLAFEPRATRRCPQLRCRPAAAPSEVACLLHADRPSAAPGPPEHQTLPGENR